MNIEIRKAKKEDLLGCAKLMDEQSLEYAPGKHQGIGDFEKNFDSAVFFVATQNEEIVGFCYAFIMSPEMAFIDNFVVKKELRGHGIGSRLIETLEQELKKSAESIWLISNANCYENKEFYKKKAYQQGHDFTFFWKEF